MKNVLVLLLPLLFIGCAGSEIVKTTMNPVGGVIQYKNGLFVRDQSRKLALEKLNEFCKGSYKIISEEFNKDVLSLNVSGTYFTPDKANYMFINFTCDK